MLGVPFFDFHSPFHGYIGGPVDFNLLVFKTCLQGREAALSGSCRVRSEMPLETSLFCKQHESLGTYCSHLMCGSSSFSTVLGIFS